MSKAKSYQGHHCWNCWNVSLWIANDEGLYRLALDCIRENKGRQAQAEAFIAAIEESLYDSTTRFVTHTPRKRLSTPDGAPYTVSSVKAAFVGLE